MQISNLQDKELSIGAVFTPLKWAFFAIEEFQIFQKWIAGATIFDPTMGEGNLLFALIEYGIAKGYAIKDLPIHQLYGVELNEMYYNTFFEKGKIQYGIHFLPENYQNKDIFFLEKEQKFDIIFGNPPWQNFGDLPISYKEKIKPVFFKYDLVQHAQDLLLGGSRIDIAAVVMQKVIQENTLEKGECVFFMPLSLLLNDGANSEFRTYKVNKTYYHIDKIFDFHEEKVFGSVATRYGLVHFQRDEKQVFPIPYLMKHATAWKNYEAKPLLKQNNPLSIIEVGENSPLSNFSPIVLKKENTPRQGINTCGVNDIFFFERCENTDNDDDYLLNGEIILPKKYIFPLITSKNFKENGKEKPLKWVLLPCYTNGKPIELADIHREPALLAYLEKHKARIQARKGTLINVWLKKGYWWAFLGVGEYSFSPYKVVWEAYGKNTFKALIFEGNWQANQSLQAFMPAKNLEEAEKIAGFLNDKQIENYLLSLKMEGTMNWAQPGKIKKLISFEEPNQLLLNV